MRQAPEAAIISETALAMARTLGLFGPHAQETAVTKDILNGLQTMLPYQLPFADIYDAAMKGSTETSKYQGPGDISAGDSDSARMVTDIAGAIMGGASEIVGAGLEGATQTWKRGGGFWEAMSKAFGYAGETLRQKAPEPIGQLLGGVRRHYTRGQVRERNLDAFKKIGQVEGLLSEMTKDLHDRTGQYHVPTVRDPAALRMMNEMKSAVNSGMMLELKHRRSTKYSMIERLDLNRDKMSPHEYTLQSEALKQEIQDLDIQMQENIQRLNSRLHGAYSQYGVNDIDSAIGYIKSKRQP
jgi:hypothetical protein